MTVRRIDLLPKQKEFFLSSHYMTAYVGGLGAGKSYILAFWIITTSLKYPKSKGLLAANSYKQLNTATMEAVHKILGELNIPYTYKGELGKGQVLRINGGREIYCRSLENYEDLNGIEIGFAGVDEAAFAKKEAVQKVEARLRDKNGPLQVRLATTPNGFNWVYDNFVTEIKHERMLLVRATSSQNHHLPESYLESLKATYDPKMLQQEMEGMFVNTNSGQIYYAFDRRNADIVKPWGKPVPHDLLLGVDFNVNPLCAVVYVNGGGWLHAIDEFYLKDSNTFELADKIKEKYPNNRISFVADATGKARKTSSRISDIQILREAGFISLTPKSNPAQKDRFNAMNGALYHGKLFIDAEKCPYYIKDLEQVTSEDFKAGGNPALTHISDAGGYPVYKLFEIKKPQRRRSVIV